MMSLPSQDPFSLTTYTGAFLCFLPLKINFISTYIYDIGTFTYVRQRIYLECIYISVYVFIHMSSPFLKSKASVKINTTKDIFSIRLTGFCFAFDIQ